MKKLLALILALCMIFGATLSLFSCEDYYEYNPEEDDVPPSAPENNVDKSPAIAVPEYKDYGRGTVDFDKIIYKRPDVNGIADKFNDVAEKVEANAMSFEEQLALIKALEDEYNDLLTMRSFANIMNSRDSSDSFYAAEHKYISTAYPKFISAVEKMMAACAKSAHAERFESEYFGSGFVEKYKNGIIYTDEVVVLMEREAELEVASQSFSTDEVVISVYGETNTAQYFYDYYAEKYQNNTTKLNNMNLLITTAYNGEVKRLSKPILVDLFKVRRLIADELGYDSYAKLAYSTLYHDYTEAEAMALFESVASDVVQVYAKLSSTVFYSYSTPQDVKNIHENLLINQLYATYSETDEDLFEIFSYMLQHKLYDIKPTSANRFDGAFSVYLKENHSPFIFVSTDGFLIDILTLAHEFGHFSDFYINDGASTSLDLSEVSSQALELLTICALKGDIKDEHYEYLKYTQLENIMMSIISQSFYAYFEHLAYALPYDEISEQSLNECVLEAAEKFSLNTDSINSIDSVIISHIFLYPFYVQSYVTSALTSLEIYFKEVEKTGAGFEAYKTLVSRESGLSFTEHLDTVGLTSPFDNELPRNIADKIYFHIVGAHYYKQSANEKT